MEATQEETQFGIKLIGGEDVKNVPKVELVGKATGHLQEHLYDLEVVVYNKENNTDSGLHALLAKRDLWKIQINTHYGLGLAHQQELPKVVALVGGYSEGKTWVASQLCFKETEKALPSGPLPTTLGFAFVRPVQKAVYCLLDTPGSSPPCPNIEVGEDEKLNKSRFNNVMCTDYLIRHVAYDVADVFIYVTSKITLRDQRVLRKLRDLDNKRNIFVVHNVKDVTRFEDLSGYLTVTHKAYPGKLKKTLNGHETLLMLNAREEVGDVFDREIGAEWNRTIELGGLSGYLKKAKSNYGWKKVWCVLRSSEKVLDIYKDKGKDLSTRIHLDQIKQVSDPTEKNHFVVELNHNNLVMKFEAVDAEVAKKWTSALKEIPSHHPIIHLEDSSGFVHFFFVNGLSKISSWNSKSADILRKYLDTAISKKDNEPLLTRITKSLNEQIPSLVQVEDSKWVISAIGEEVPLILQQSFMPKVSIHEIISSKTLQMLIDVPGCTKSDVTITRKTLLEISISIKREKPIVNADDIKEVKGLIDLPRVGYGVFSTSISFKDPPFNSYDIQKLGYGVENGVCRITFPSLALQTYSDS